MDPDPAPEPDSRPLVPSPGETTGVSNHSVVKFVTKIRAAWRAGRRTLPGRPVQDGCIETGDRGTSGSRQTSVRSSGGHPVVTHPRHPQRTAPDTLSSGGGRRTGNAMAYRPWRSASHRSTAHGWPGPGFWASLTRRRADRGRGRHRRGGCRARWRDGYRDPPCRQDHGDHHEREQGQGNVFHPAASPSCRARRRPSQRPISIAESSRVVRVDTRTRRGWWRRDPPPPRPPRPAGRSWP